MNKKHGKKITVEEAADILEGFALELTEIDILPGDFYYGIGKDMDERSEWHRTHNLIYKNRYLSQCGSRGKRNE